jgi:hypothetical protein
MNSYRRFAAAAWRMVVTGRPADAEAMAGGKAGAAVTE